MTLDVRTAAQATIKSWIKEREHTWICGGGKSSSLNPLHQIHIRQVKQTWSLIRWLSPVEMTIELVFNDDLLMNITVRLGLYNDQTISLQRVRRSNTGIPDIDNWTRSPLSESRIIEYIRSHRLFGSSWSSRVDADFPGASAGNGLLSIAELDRLYMYIFSSEKAEEFGPIFLGLDVTHKLLFIASEADLICRHMNRAYSVLWRFWPLPISPTMERPEFGIDMPPHRFVNGDRAGLGDPWKDKPTHEHFVTAIDCASPHDYVPYSTASQSFRCLIPSLK